MTSQTHHAQLATPVGERDHTQGPATAAVTLLEYGDFECPYSGAARPIVKQVQQRLRDRLRVGFREFPLREIHRHAQDAAEAAEAAAAQGKFWELYDLLFEHQRQLHPEHLAAYAQQAGLDTAAFTDAMAKHSYAARVAEDVQSGIASRVGGTPTFFINGVRHDASYNFATLLAAIERAEREAGVPNTGEDARSSSIPADGVAVTDNRAAHRYEAWIEGALALIEYALEGDRIIFVHTEVPELLEGRGIASALARVALDDARARELTVVPLCPFVSGYIRRHQEYLSLVDAAYRSRLA